MDNIKKCVCKSEYQDEKYGKDMRVHNPIGKKDNPNKLRCAVCNNERN
jgi:hypothetical protein